jgi:hypothetical protein
MDSSGDYNKVRPPGDARVEEIIAILNSAHQIPKLPQALSATIFEIANSREGQSMQVPQKMKVI